MILTFSLGCEESKAMKMLQYLSTHKNWSGAMNDKKYGQKCKTYAMILIEYDGSGMIYYPQNGSHDKECSQKITDILQSG